MLSILLDLIVYEHRLEKGIKDVIGHFSFSLIFAVCSPECVACHSFLPVLQGKLLQPLFLLAPQRTHGAEGPFLAHVHPIKDAPHDQFSEGTHLTLVILLHLSS